MRRQRTHKNNLPPVLILRNVKVKVDMTSDRPLSIGLKKWSTIVRSDTVRWEMVEWLSGFGTCQKELAFLMSSFSRRKVSNRNA